MERNDRGPEGKRALLEALHQRISRWDGVTSFDRQEERAVRSLLERLEAAPHVAAERHLLNLYETWLSKARRKPDPPLREQWLQAVNDWFAYLDEHAFLAE